MPWVSFDAPQASVFSFGSSHVNVVQDLRACGCATAHRPQVDAGYAFVRSGTFLRVRGLEGPSGLVASSRYDYDTGGSLSVQLTFLLPDGRHAAGTFEAALLECSVLVAGEDTDPPVAHGQAWARLGRGLFDARTARLLGVAPRTTGGLLTLRMDAIEGGYTAPDRQGLSSGYLDVEVPALAFPTDACRAEAAASRVRWGLRRLLE